MTEQRATRHRMTHDRTVPSQMTHRQTAREQMAGPRAGRGRALPWAIVGLVVVIAAAMVAFPASRAWVASVAHLGKGHGSAGTAQGGTAQGGTAHGGTAHGNAGPANAPAGQASGGQASKGGNASALPPLSAAQLAGQRVIYSYSGLTPPAGLLRLIRQGEVGGVIFFGQNISSKAQLAGAVRVLDRANASPQNPVRAYPLLLMTDQEGGVVRRLPGAPVLSEKQIGASAHPANAATSAGTGAGKNLAGAGLDVNLAPVLDVYRTAGDFDDQFGRSYSKDPATVSRLGRNFIKAQQAAGVAATGKHFPGLGAATRSQNTDERPVTLPVSKQHLRSIDEFPYQAAIAAGLKLVMVSWAVYPALDPKMPAGLSHPIVRDELRQRLGFAGVTITDALEAGALRAFGTMPQRGTLAAKAGMDLILCSDQHPNQGERVSGALAKGYSSGAINQPAFRASVHRILTLRAGLKSSPG
jgi:beta-N-acetylhexosaminidase